MKILALDLGTKTGWALLHYSEVVSGTWTLATPREIRQQKLDSLDRCCDLRPARLRELIKRVGAVDLIAFEDVQFLSTQYQAQLWASLRAMVTLEYPATELLAVPVGTLKKFATGKGNATKEEMLAALFRQNPFSHLAQTRRPNADMDDNEVDALHLLAFAVSKQK